jgi:hypothetical protein
MIRIILKHNNKVTTNDLIEFDIRKRGDEFRLYGVDELRQEKGKTISVENIENITLQYKDGRTRILMSECDIKTLLS